MSSILVVLLVFICHVVICNTKVEARLFYNISVDEMELEKQLKLLNKPAVKSIRSGYGDVYDCVDFYQQPAFDHPLLKDYKYDYKVLDEIRKPSNSIFKEGGCPVGTVPIRRTTKEDLIRERYISATRPSVDDDEPGAHYAVIRTKPSGKKYNGAGGQLSLHNPQCTDNQYSAARLKINNGPDSIEAGWRVDPSLYGDKKTRLFIRFNAGKVSCFNTRCPGFIIVNTEIPLDTPHDGMSTQPPYNNLQVLLNRDLINGNWWLELGSDRIEVGFWPARIFTGLSDWATSAEWGGEVFSPPGTIKPPMGVGKTISTFSRVDAYIFNCILFDGKSTLSADNVKVFADSKTYRAVNGGRESGGHLVLYGGPSGY